MGETNVLVVAFASVLILELVAEAGMMVVAAAAEAFGSKRLRIVAAKGMTIALYLFGATSAVVGAAAILYVVVSGGLNGLFE